MHVLMNCRVSILISCQFQNFHNVCIFYCTTSNLKEILTREKCIMYTRLSPKFPITLMWYCTLSSEHPDSCLLMWISECKLKVRGMYTTLGYRSKLLPKLVGNIPFRVWLYLGGGNYRYSSWWQWQIPVIIFEKP